MQMILESESHRVAISIQNTNQMHFLNSDCSLTCTASWEINPFAIFGFIFSNNCSLPMFSLNDGPPPQKKKKHLKKQSLSTYRRAD